MTQPHPSRLDELLRQKTRALATLLILVVLLQFGYPVADYGPLWTALYLLFYASMLGFGILTVRADGEPTWPMALVTAVFLVSGGWFSLFQDSTPALVAMLTSVALSMGALIFFLLRFVFRSRSETLGLDHVIAAITAYLVIGGFFSAIMTLLEIAVPGSFQDPQTSGGAMEWGQMLYYSYVSLSTLGYGDIVPVTPWARALGSLVAVSGTLYLAVVMARLVSIWTVTRRETSPDQPAN